MGYKPRSPIEDYPEHAAALGRMLSYWALMELSLQEVLGYLLGVDQFRAQFVWQEFVSTRAKITLLQRLNFNFTKDDAMKSSLDSILARAGKLNSKRNGFVHALWGAGTNGLTRFATTSPPSYKKPDIPPDDMTAESIQAVVEEIRTLSEDLFSWKLRFRGVELPQSGQ